MKMKQLLLATMTLAVFAGCMKSMDAVPDPYENPNPQEGQKMSFQASIDGPYVSKVSIPTDSFYTVWDEGDIVGVKTPTKISTYSANVGGDIWTNLKYVSGDAPEGDESVQFFFPSDFETNGLPSSYNYDEISGDVVKNLPMAAEAQEGETSIKFKYLCGVAKFKYTNASNEDIKIKQIDFTSKLPLSGKGTVKLGGVPSFILDGNAGVSITFDENNSVLKSGETINFCLPLPEGIYKKIVMNIIPIEGDPIIVKVAGKISVARAGQVKVDLSYVPGPDDPVDGDDLSLNGTANSYIVFNGGSYKIPAVKGNSPATEIINDVASAEVLWETLNTREIPEAGDLISDCDFIRGWVCFEVNAGALGNALIAAKDASGKILWTWHIWMTNGPVGIEEHGGYQFMDRHLGQPKAIDASKVKDDVEYQYYSSLNYQWGRKDPFPGTTPNTAKASRTFILSSNKVFTSGSSVPSKDGPVSVETAIENPTTFYKGTSEWCSDPIEELWSEKKTIYDPCPAGWRVPDNIALSSYKGDPWANTSGLYQDPTKTVYWPNILTIVGSSGALGANNNCIIWDNGYSTVIKIYYVSSKFSFVDESLTNYPHTTGGTIRCQAE